MVILAAVAARGSAAPWSIRALAALRRRRAPRRHGRSGGATRARARPRARPRAAAVDRQAVQQHVEQRVLSCKRTYFRSKYFSGIYGSTVKRYRVKVRETELAN